MTADEKKAKQTEEFGRQSAAYGTILFSKERDLVWWVAVGDLPDFVTQRASEPARLATEEIRNLFLADPENRDLPLLYGSRRVEADAEGRTTLRTGWARYRDGLFKTNTRVRYGDSSTTFSLSVGWGTPSKNWRWVSRSTKDKNDVLPFFARLVRMASAEQAAFMADADAVQADQREPRPVYKRREKPRVPWDRAEEWGM